MGSYFLKGLILSLLLLTSRAFSETINTCAPFQSVTIGSYIVQTDYWQNNLCKGTQCLSIDDQTGAFTITKGDYNCAADNYVAAAYPDILYGYAFGNRSPHSDLPAQISSLNCVNTSWSFQPTHTGRWDAAYDIWICPDNTCGPSGFNGGLELMIWLDYTQDSGWQYDMGPATVDGMNWEVWQFDGTSPSGLDTHKCVSYLAKTKTDSVQNLDIKPFMDDCQARGYLKPSWYLYAIEVGTEFNWGGIPFTSKSFSVSVNKDCGAKPIYTPLPTPVPTASPTPDTRPIPMPPN
jgi:hypothetical protein